MPSDVMLEALKQTVARVEVDGEPNGTAFLVGRKHVATALHVLGRRTTVDLVFVEWPTDRKRIGVRTWRHPVYDVAILELDNECPSDIRPFPWATTPAVGDRWASFGFPAQVPDGQPLVEQRINDPSLLIEELDLRVLHLHSPEAQYDLGGFSGAPCVVDGAIVGVIAYQLRRDARRLTDQLAREPSLYTLYALPISLIAGVDSLVPGRVLEWLEVIEHRCSHISFTGIGASNRSTSRPRHAIEAAWVPIRALLAVDDDGEGTEASVPVTRILRQHKALIISGHPGSGKSMLLRLIACCLARDMRGQPCASGGSSGRSWQETYLGLIPGPRVELPILLHLSDLARVVGERSNRAEQSLLELVSNTTGLGEAECEKRFENGEAVFLLDGLDEIAAGEPHESVCSVLAAARKAWPDCYWIVTSRPYDIALLKESGFVHAHIVDLTTEEIVSFVSRWGALFATPESDDANAFRSALFTAINGVPSIGAMARNPLLLTCLCVVQRYEGKLPSGRSRLYEAALRWLIDARTNLRNQNGFPLAFVSSAFEALALGMQQGANNDSLERVEIPKAARNLVSVVGGHIPNIVGTRDQIEYVSRWLHFESTVGGIVEATAVRSVRFWHASFREFLAARRLAARDALSLAEDGASTVLASEVLPILHQPQWQETVELLVGCLLDTGGAERVDALFETIVGGHSKNQSLVEEARISGILGRLLKHVEVYGYVPSEPTRLSYKSLVHRSQRILEPENLQSVPLNERITAIDAIGQSPDGDPRLRGVPTKRLVQFVLEGGVRLGRFPVTVQEYRRFIAQGGYHKAEYWKFGGWSQRSRWGWEEPSDWKAQLLHPNRRVVGVSWFEANAYCSWLSAELRVSARLPTLREWQVCAGLEKFVIDGRPEDRVLPQDPAVTVNAVAPIGTVSEWRGPYGHEDICTGMWEWIHQIHVSTRERGQRRWGQARAVPPRARQRRARARLPSVGFRIAVVPEGEQG